MFKRKLKNGENPTIYSLANGYRKVELRKNTKYLDKEIFSIVYYEFDEALCSEEYNKLNKAKKAYKEFIDENNYLEN